MPPNDGTNLGKYACSDFSASLMNNSISCTCDSQTFQVVKFRQQEREFKLWLTRMMLAFNMTDSTIERDCKCMKKSLTSAVWMISTHSHLQVAIPHYGYKHVDKNERHSDH